MNKEDLLALLDKIADLSYDGWCDCDLMEQTEFIDFFSDILETTGYLTTKLEMESK